MELVEGETLRHWLERQERTEIAAVTRIATEVAPALGAAHASGIVHRDIKPDDIIVRADGSIKVLDFGVAKLATASDSQATQAATSAGLVVGTARYMAPEQARGMQVDSRADVFSLGVVLYELLSGTPPFSGATPTTRALELNPRLAHAQSGRASVFMLQGRYEEALAPALKSVELDPLAPMWGLFLMCIQFGRGRYDDAEARAMAALTFEPRNWTAHWIRGLVRIAHDDFPAASGSLEEAVRHSGRNPRPLGTLIHALARSGDRRDAERELAALEETASQRFVPQLAFATAYTGLGDFDRAFSALDRSFEEKDNWLRHAWWEPSLFRLRSDARMSSLMKRMGLSVQPEA